MCLCSLAQFYNNKVILQRDGNYGNGACSGSGMTTVYGNQVFSPTGAITECGMSLAEWQAKGAVHVGALCVSEEACVCMCVCSGCVPCMWTWVYWTVLVPV